MGFDQEKAFKEELGKVNAQYESMIGGIGRDIKSSKIFESLDDDAPPVVMAFASIGAMGGFDVVVRSAAILALFHSMAEAAKGTNKKDSDKSVNHTISMTLTEIASIRTVLRSTQ